MWIDSHCHLDGEEYKEDRAATMERAAAASVDGLVAIGGGAEPGTLACGLEVARQHSGHAGVRVWATLGVHPHEAARASAATWDEMQRLAASPEVIAIGEIGLDYHYDHSPRERQLGALERQLRLAADCGLPVSIHCREAFDDCLAAIERQNPPRCGVFHCFAGNREQAERVLALGWYLSFSGMLTFARADELRRVAAWAPADRVLVETDAPYLAPVPHRGRRNEPAWVAETGAQLAALRGLSLDEAAALTRGNFFRLFAGASV